MNMERIAVNKMVQRLSHQLSHMQSHTSTYNSRSRMWNQDLGCLVKIHSFDTVYKSYADFTCITNAEHIGAIRAAIA